MLNVFITLLLQNKIALSLLFILPVIGFTQSIEVSDTAFARKICNAFPQVMNESCQSLDTVKAALISRSEIVVNFGDAGLLSVDEIIHFVNADTIYLNKNNITEFPKDISKMRNIVRLNLSGNPLTTAPDIKYTNDFGADTAVKLFYIRECMVDHLPSSWEETNNFSQVIDLRDNVLTDIPSFTNYPQIRRLDVSSNYLRFDELIPIKNHFAWATEEFDLFPQKNFHLELDTLLKIGETVSFDFSSSLNTNHYSLFKDGNELDSNDVGVFNITINSMEDFGEYWIKTVNDNFTGSTAYLETEHYNLQLDYDEIEEVKKDMIVFSPNGDGQADEYLIEGEGSAIILDKNGREIRVESLPYVWHGDDASGKLLDPGLYVIKLSESAYLKVLIVR